MSRSFAKVVLSSKYSEMDESYCLYFSLRRVRVVGQIPKNRARPQWHRMTWLRHVSCLEVPQRLEVAEPLLSLDSFSPALYALCRSRLPVSLAMCLFLPGQLRKD